MVLQSRHAIIEGNNFARRGADNTHGLTGIEVPMLAPDCSFTPENEQGVVAVAGQYAALHGWSIVSISATYPDAIMAFNGKRYRVEFEYASSNFIAHGHDPRDCDLILCWKNDTPDLELPVIEVAAEKWAFTPASTMAKSLMYWRLRAKRAEGERDRARGELRNLQATLPKPSRQRAPRDPGSPSPTTDPRVAMAIAAGVPRTTARRWAATGDGRLDRYTAEARAA